MALGFRRTRPSGPWTSSAQQHFYETIDPDPSVLQIWCYSDALSYAPGCDLTLHVATTAPRFELEIWQDGGAGQRIYSASDLPGHWPDTPAGCSVTGCDWPPSLRVKLPRDCPQRRNQLLNI